MEAYETSSVKVHHVADDTDSLMIERGSFYAALLKEHIKLT